MTEAASKWLHHHAADIVAALSGPCDNASLLELALQLGHVGHWRLNLPDRALSWSTEVYCIHGLPADAPPPDIETALGYYHPDDRKAIASALASAISDGTPFEFTVRLIRADGELRHVQSRGLAIPGPDGIAAAVFGIFIDITESRKTEAILHHMNQALEQIAYLDAMTKLANRRQFDDTLDREWRRAVREETALSLVMLDVDRFKAFNDLYGHIAGDACLRSVAKVLSAVAQRPGDLAARYGGEEFAIILPCTEAIGAEKIGQAARDAVASLKLTHAGNAQCGGVVTISAGVATAYPQPDAVQGWVDFVARADAMLYEAKRTGRNRVVSPALLERAGPAPLPPNEADRLAALAACERAGAAQRSAAFDRIAQLAATLTSAPIGLVSLVGQDEQRFIGNYGLDGVNGTSRNVSFCAHTILGEDPLVVADATDDSRFRSNDLVTGNFGLRYYAGAPIVSARTGHRLGAVCTIDTEARKGATAAQRALLSELAKMAALLLDREDAEFTPL
jgi:diguanylate cyclase (GGDEF)-like protein